MSVFEQGAPSLPRNVTIVEVGPRDGFQMEATFIPTQTKVQIINQIARSGVRKIEATSFVHPNIIPQMSDALEVMRDVERLENTYFLALVPNLKGAQRALDARADGVKIVLAATESSNRKNVRMSVHDSLRQSEEILQLATSARVPSEAVLAVAFGCPYEGDVSESTNLNLVSSLASIGFKEISLADTVGVANPATVYRLSSTLVRQFPQVHFALHFHNTRGLGLANVLAGLHAGIDQFDSSIGGLGGCPIVRGGIGNVSSEDLINMLNEMEINSGITLDGIMLASQMAQQFLQRQLSSYVLAAGTRQELYKKHRDRPA
jgi:hydroxymethylglutaryl-CoA lyase